MQTNTHTTGTRQDWLNARLALLDAEKELTRRSDAVTQQRQRLPWVRIDKEYRFDTDEGSASLADLFRGRSQLLIYHFMFGPDYTAGCPSCSSIADGFNGIAVHLENHDVGLMAVSRAPLAKLQAFKRRMGWSFPWASSFNNDFNPDFSVCFTPEEQRAGIDYNFRHEKPTPDIVATKMPEWSEAENPIAQIAATAGTNVPTFLRDLPGMSAFAMEDGVVYHTYSTYARGLDGLWGMYQWLDRAPLGSQRARLLVASPRFVSAGLIMRTLQSSQRFIGVSAALFIGSAALTIGWCTSMPAIHDMPMCSTRSPTPLHDAAAFLIMWLTMMIAMMSPSLMPMLLRYRDAIGTTPRADVLSAYVAFGYFCVWTVAGAAAFAGSTIVSQLTTLLPWLVGETSSITGVIAILAGALQFCRWKMHHLACCREMKMCCTRSADASTAFRYGLRLGMHCVHCCSGLTVVLLVVGMMDVRAMALVTAAISLERLAPGGMRAARFVGIVLIATGAFLIA